VAPDLQLVAEMKLKNLVPSLGNPQALSSAILGAIRGSSDGKEGSSRTTINDIVGAVTGRTQQPAEPPKDDGAAPQPQPDAAKPEEKKDTIKEVQDAVRDLLRRKKSQEKPPEPAPPAPEK
jgi:hypothetical protein